MRPHEPMTATGQLNSERQCHGRQLTANLVERERGAQRVVEVAFENLRFTSGHGLDDPAGIVGRVGSDEVHDVDHAFRTAETQDLAPQHQRIRQVVQRVLRQDGIEGTVGESSCRKAVAPKGDTLVESCFSNCLASESNHRRRSVQGRDSQLWCRPRQPDRYITRAAPEVDGRAWVAWQVAQQPVDEQLIRCAEIGSRVRARLRFIVHELGFENPLHAAVWIVRAGSTAGPALRVAEQVRALFTDRYAGGVRRRVRELGHDRGVGNA